LIKGFDKRFPRHPEIPAVYLFAARVVGEDLHQEESARKILTVLVQRYPDHGLTGEARSLLRALERPELAVG
jgi:hypothetical protein